MVGCEGEGGEFWDWVGELCAIWHIVWQRGVVLGDDIARDIFCDKSLWTIFVEKTSK